MRALGTLVVIGALAAAPCRADEFCDILMSVTKDAHTGFKHARGEPSYIGKHISYRAASLPGMKSSLGLGPCSISPSLERANFYRYSCDFPSNVRDYRPVSEHVEACLKASGEVYRKQSPHEFEKMRWSLDQADIAIGFDIASDSWERFYYLFVDPKKPVKRRD
jgi:hypothetical protein